MSHPCHIELIATEKEKYISREPGTVVVKKVSKKKMARELRAQRQK